MTALVLNSAASSRSHLPAGPGQLAIATFNVETSTLRRGRQVRHARRADRQQPARLTARARGDPGQQRATNDGTRPGRDHTYNADRNAAIAPGGPTYQFRNVNPVDDQDGGEPGATSARASSSAPIAALPLSTAPGATVDDSQQGRRPAQRRCSSFSPAASTRPTPPSTPAQAARGEFRSTAPVFVIGNHFKSKGGDHPLFGRFQPPVRRARRSGCRRPRSSTTSSIPSWRRRNANVIVLGDLNDFEFSQRSHSPSWGRDVLSSLLTTPPKRTLLVRLRGQLAGARPDPREREPSSGSRSSTTSST